VRRPPGRFTTADPVIAVNGLRKSYDELQAIAGLDLEVRAGEVFAFLGPNGAGKTTTVEILEGYRPRDGGDVAVLGADPRRPPRGWHARIGVVLQACNQESYLTVRETISQYASYYPAPRSVDQTIELVGLTPQRDRRVGKLSGGQQRRLDVALALIGDPELLFLDEPTTGFDPAARRRAWTLISDLRELGKTIFLTTHYMDEAQALADRVAIIAGGKLVAHGSPGELSPGPKLAEISFRVPEGIGADELPVAGAMDDGRATLRTGRPLAALHALTTWALEQGLDELPDLEVRRPSLEDVYLDLTEGE